LNSFFFVAVMSVTRGAVMPRLKSERAAELEAFWRSHHEEWASSLLNQREYCEAHGLPLKRFGNWRAKFKDEAAAARKGLLYRRGGGLSHMSSHMTNRDNELTSTGYIPSGRGLPEARRNFRQTDKRRIVAEAGAPGASVSAVARRYGIAPRLLFRWKQELAAPQAQPKTGPVFLPVAVSDAAVTAEVAPAGPEPLAKQAHGPLIIERTPQEIEVELVGGRRLCFARDTDPETVRALVALLEGTRS
jgi:transposase-like protein